MIVILFLSCVVFGVLRNMKDTLVVTSPGGGADVIPFLKVWGILPMAVLLTGAYTRLAAWMSQARVYYAVISAFLLYFIFFATVLYPYRDSLHPHAFADWAESVLPAGLHGMVAMVRNWTYTSLYIFAELWGSLVLSVMFWGYANQTTGIQQAKRFYGTMTIFSNLGAVCSGLIGVCLTLTEVHPYLPGNTAWEQSQNLFIAVVIISCIVMLFTYEQAFRLDAVDGGTGHATVKKKARMSLKEGFSCLGRYPYLARIAILVIGYNLTINLVETTWKDQVRQLYPAAVDYNAYMANVTVAIGIISCAVSVVMSWVIQRMGWTFTALLTPLFMLLTSAGFFACLLLGESSWAPGLITLGAQPLALTVFFGGAQNAVSKGAKYSVFDGTKEMAFIPLSQNIKMQGKAAIDGVGSRMAKSGSSLIQQGLLLVFGSLSASAPVIALLVFGVLGVWTRSVLKLGNEFFAITHPSADASCGSDREEEGAEATAV
jgi:AAA family ATP:ADP antiporter